ncbi:FAD-dependent monooxygenase phnB [Pseudocercospora fuligena]|uniref:FAD-dependent monooxygenase phnB n=1 Tax=Pseudocercospora fuligena TaxID=685502 RepID=A0A8H6R8N7_9PEZI|nr:FAD-dependent monooxygenase phnB [Pseudocercospora fuligena]
MTESSNPTAGLHVVIIGAGVSGLLLAQGLKKNGISFTIYESEESLSHYRPREWGMSIQWALPMLSALLPDKLHERLQTASVDPHYNFPESGNAMPVYNAETGELVKSIPLVKMLRVSRRKMRALCAEGIDVQYGKALKSLARPNKSSISVQFADGTSVSGSLVVGADGATSVVRSEAFAGGPAGQASQVPYSGVNMHVCYHDAATARSLRESLSPIMAIGAHPRGYWLWLSVQDVPDPASPENWVFQLQWTWRDGAETAPLAELNLAKLKAEAAEVFSEPFKSAWTNIPDGTPVPKNRISIWAPKGIAQELWNGRVALVGDAAHAMSFHRGQGLNHGIADAVKLTEALTSVSDQDGLRAAVGDYETEMIARAGEEVRVSKLNTEMMHDWARLKESPFMQRGGDKNQ